MGFFEKKNKKDSDNKSGSQVRPEKKEEGKESMKDLYGEKQAGGKKQPTKSAEEKKQKKEVKSGQAYKILVKPLITEKASILGAENKYFFEVSPSANKIEVAKAINEVYGVNPVSVNIIKMKGKRVRYGRTEGKKKDWKKAIVTLPKGETIKVYEGV